MPSTTNKSDNDAANEPDCHGNAGFGAAESLRLGISRWTGTGGSYRTVVRFFHTVIPWAAVFWVFFRQYLFCPNDVYLLAGDEVVITKAGKKNIWLE